MKTIALFLPDGSKYELEIDQFLKIDLPPGANLELWDGDRNPIQIAAVRQIGGLGEVILPDGAHLVINDKWGEITEPIDVLEALDLYNTLSCPADDNEQEEVHGFHLLPLSEYEVNSEEEGDDSSAISRPRVLESITIDLLGSDTELAGPRPTIVALADEAVLPGSLVHLANGAMVQLNDNGSVQYHPGDGFNYLGEGEEANDSFSYWLEDLEGEIHRSEVTVTIIGEGDPVRESSESEIIYGPAFDFDEIAGSESNEPSESVVYSKEEENETAAITFAVTGDGEELFTLEATPAIQTHPSLRLDSLEVEQVAIQAIEVDGIMVIPSPELPIMLDSGGSVAHLTDGTLEYSAPDNIPIDECFNDRFRYRFVNATGETSEATLNVTLNREGGHLSVSAIAEAFEPSIESVPEIIPSEDEAEEITFSFFNREGERETLTLLVNSDRDAPDKVIDSSMQEQDSAEILPKEVEIEEENSSGETVEVCVVEETYEAPDWELEDRVAIESLEVETYPAAEFSELSHEPETEEACVADIDSSDDQTQEMGETEIIVSEVVIGTQGDCDDISEEDVVEASEEDVVEASEEDVVEASEEDVVEDPEEDVVEASEEDVVEASAEDVVEAPEEDVVEASEEDVVEASEEVVVEASEEDVVEASEEDVVMEASNQLGYRGFALIPLVGGKFSYLFSNGSVRGQMIDKSGEPTGGTSSLCDFFSSLEHCPVVNDSLNRFSLTWVTRLGEAGQDFGIACVELDEYGNRQSQKILPAENLTDSQYISSAIRLEDRSHIIAFSDQSNESNWIQRIEGSGSRSVIESPSNGTGEMRLVGLLEGGFMTYQSRQTKDGFAIAAQMYYIDGTKFGGGFTLNESPLNESVEVNAARLDNGNVVFTWLVSDSVIVRVYDSAADLFLTGDLIVSNSLDPREVSSGVHPLNDGGFLIYWLGAEEGQIGLQNFDESGNRVGDEIEIHRELPIAELPLIAQDGSGTILMSYIEEGNQKPEFIEIELEIADPESGINFQAIELLRKDGNKFAEDWQFEIYRRAIGDIGVRLSPSLILSSDPSDLHELTVRTRESDGSVTDQRVNFESIEVVDVSFRGCLDRKETQTQLEENRESSTQSVEYVETEEPNLNMEIQSEQTEEFAEIDNDNDRSVFDFWDDAEDVEPLLESIVGDSPSKEVAPNSNSSDEEVGV